MAKGEAGPARALTSTTAEMRQDRSKGKGAGTLDAEKSVETDPVSHLEAQKPTTEAQTQGCSLGARGSQTPTQVSSPAREALPSRGPIPTVLSPVGANSTKSTQSGGAMMGSAGGKGIPNTLIAEDALNVEERGNEVHRQGHVTQKIR